MRTNAKNNKTNNKIDAVDDVELQKLHKNKRSANVTF
jgi:hypothetical protein